MRTALFSMILLVGTALNALADTWEGQPFPAFQLSDQKGLPHDNKQYLGHWLVVYFYPKDNTPGCSLEAHNFAEDYALFKALDTEILGVSYDDSASHQAFVEEYHLPFALLVDVDAKLSKSLKVDRLLPFPHADRQTFIVDPQGRIRVHYEKVLPARHSEQLLARLKALQGKSDASADASSQKN